MILGYVNAFREAVVPVTVRDAAGAEHVWNAVVDTGYTRCLTLRLADVGSLGLPYKEMIRTILGDGTTVLTPVFSAVVVWDGAIRLIDVDVSDTDPLLGMELLEGFRLEIAVTSGGVVQITPLP